MNDFNIVNLHGAEPDSDRSKLARFIPEPTLEDKGINYIIIGNTLYYNRDETNSVDKDEDFYGGGGGKRKRRKAKKSRRKSRKGRKSRRKAAKKSRKTRRRRRRR